MKAKYSAALGDAITANGLPTSIVTDVGNHYSMRAQRVVFQQWKEDVPWAKKGDVTVALGGDIFKEVGLIPPTAVKPAPAESNGGGSEPAATATPIATAAPLGTAAPVAGSATPVAGSATPVVVP